MQKKPNFVVEADNFRESATSDLDVRINYFNDEGLVTTAVVGASQGNATINAPNVTYTAGLSSSNKFTFKFNNGIRNLR